MGEEKGKEEERREEVVEGGGGREESREKCGGRERGEKRGAWVIIWIKMTLSKCLFPLSPQLW